MDWLLLLKCFSITVGGGLAVYWLPSLALDWIYYQQRKDEPETWKLPGLGFILTLLIIDPIQRQAREPIHRQTTADGDRKALEQKKPIHLRSLGFWPRTSTRPCPDVKAGDLLSWSRPVIFCKPCA